jgi:hypothetical protein
MEGLEQGRLLYQYDEAAQRAVFFPREVGPSGDREALKWRESTGVGSIYSFTILHKAQAQKNIVLVDLDEGFRMMSSVVNCSPESLKIGLRVKAKIEVTEEGCRLVYEVADGC